MLSVWLVIIAVLTACMTDRGVLPVPTTRTDTVACKEDDKVLGMPAAFFWGATGAAVGGGIILALESALN